MGGASFPGVAAARVQGFVKLAHIARHPRLTLRNCDWLRERHVEMRLLYSYLFPPITVTLHLNICPTPHRTCFHAPCHTLIHFGRAETAQLPYFRQSKLPLTSPVILIFSSYLSDGQMAFPESKTCKLNYSII